MDVLLGHTLEQIEEVEKKKVCERARKARNPHLFITIGEGIVSHTLRLFHNVPFFGIHLGCACDLKMLY